MELQTFAEQHRVRTRRDSCGDTIIPGKHFQPDIRQTSRIPFASTMVCADGRLNHCLLTRRKSVGPGLAKNS